MMGPACSEDFKLISILQCKTNAVLLDVFAILGVFGICIHTSKYQISLSIYLLILSYNT